MQAACYGHLPSVKLLLQMGAKVNLTNKLGATALVGAAQGGFLTIVQVKCVCLIVCVCVCVCACVRVCMRACVRACVEGVSLRVVYLLCRYC